MAELICAWMPAIEKVRMVNSGTEATMSCLRLVRGFTKRDKIVKFAGCYHGHADSLLVKAGSGALTHGQPDSAGVPRAVADETIVLPFNNIEAVRAAFRENKDQIAGIILEPIPANAGLFFPREDFLHQLQEECTRNGTLLIFDEVMTGFRVGRGGAQQLYGVRPDLTCLGKVVGGGLPLGVYGGRANVMGVVAPEGPVYQAGTLSGNPLAVSAGIATLKKLDDAAYRTLEMLGGMLEDGMSRVIRRSGVKARIQRAGSAFTLFFTDMEVTNLASAKLADTARFAKFFHAMLDRGFYLPPAQLEAAFISLAHTPDDIESFVVAAKEVFATL